MNDFQPLSRDDLEAMSRDELMKAAQRAQELTAEALGERQRFIESSYDGYWDWNLETNYEYMSPRFWEILGIDPKTKKHDPAEWQDLIFPDDLKLALENFQRHVDTRGEHPYVQEVRYRHADGSTVTVYCRGQVIEWSPDGKPRRMIGTHTDITSLRTAETELKRASTDRSSVIDSLRRIDTELRRSYEVAGSDDSDQESLSLSGRTALGAIAPRERLGRSAGILIADEQEDNRRDLQKILEPLGEEIEQASSGKDALRKILDRDFAVIVINVRMPGIDGLEVASRARREGHKSRIPIIFVTDEERDTGRVFKGYELGAVDYLIRPISPEVILAKVRVFVELNRAQEVLRRAGDDKSRLIKYLNEVNDELKRSNEDLDDFAHIASHDLKSPLRGIDNLAKWVLEDAGDGLPDDCRSDLLLLRQRASRMEGLLDGLLHYSRVGRIHQGLSLTDVGTVVDEISSVIDVPSGYQITHDELPVGETKATPLNVVLRNLIANAIKHREDDRGHVHISWERRGDLACFHVQDDGPGIPESQHQKIFRLFSTIKRRDELEASGLGLAIVKKTIEREGGTIGVANNTGGKGVTFTFSWPIAAG